VLDFRLLGAVPRLVSRDRALTVGKPAFPDWALTALLAAPVLPADVAAEPHRLRSSALPLSWQVSWQPSCPESAGVPSDPAAMSGHQAARAAGDPGRASRARACRRAPPWTRAFLLHVR